MIVLFILFAIFTGCVISKTICELMNVLKLRMGEELDFSSSAMFWTFIALSLSLLTWFLLGFGFYTTVRYIL